MDHTKPNFRVFLAYGMLEKIVRDIETWRGMNLELIWSFWTQWRKRFVVLECGLEDIDGQLLIVEIQDPMVKIQAYLHKKKTQGKISWEEVWKHIIMKLVE